MFVNRFIKALQKDVEKLRGGKMDYRGHISPFIFPTANVNDPDITILGKKLPAAVFFYAALSSAYDKGRFMEPDNLFRAECQFFDFGFIDNEMIKEESKTVAEGYEVGLIDLPATTCWMEHRWNDDGGPTISGYLFMRDDVGILAAEIRLLSRNKLIESQFKVDGHTIMMTDALHEKEYFVWDGTILHLPQRASSKSYEAGIICNTANQTPNPCNLFDPLMSMLGRLNADGIHQEHVPAPPKLNRRREAKGLPGVVSHTKVTIRPHRDALGHSGPRSDGFYTPKRYHFRRGHVRHFENGEVTWVRPCFVGDPADGIVKHTYEIKD